MRLALISNDTCLDPRNGGKFPCDHKFLRAKLEVKREGKGVKGRWGDRATGRQGDSRDGAKM